MSHGRDDVAAGSSDLRFREETSRRLQALEEEVARLVEYVNGSRRAREEQTIRMMQALSGATGEEAES